MTADKFWKNADKTTTECWLWLGATNGGYAWVHFNGKAQRGHRLAYVLTKGHVPEGLEIEHICEVLRCINPEHLVAVTHRFNMLRHTTGITRCPKGHLYNKENTYTSPSGYRFCKICRRIVDKLRYAEGRHK